ncbi:phosphatase PAP2 family protein [Falsiroseomonas sp. HW251]|uniref:phosphatase PAP2 family protein n=1 Tax=Falsiroseomonas sp. HW251 TaxID=3390998 RepID=UPI003D31CA05
MISAREAIARAGERLELRVVLAVLLVAGALWGFVALAGEVMEGETLAFDRALLLALRDPANPADPLGPSWLREVGRDMTALGGIAVLTLLTIGVLAFMALRALWGAAGLLLASVLGGMVASNLLKAAFDRARPDLVPHGSIVMTASFPSGHAMMSAVVYLTLGVLLARVEPRRRDKAFILSCAVFLTLLVGVSRVYLGVHWPTDVLAGWCLGAAWALGCWLVARWLQRRGAVETDHAGQ